MHRFARADPEMTVDSEAIFAVAAHSRNDARALEELRGSMATAWLDEREPDLIFVARGVGRPLWLGEGRARGLLRLDRDALEVVERRCGSGCASGSCAKARRRRSAGRVVRRERFRPIAYVEDVLPSVRAPAEGASASAARRDRRSPPRPAPTDPSERPRPQPSSSSRCGRGTGTSPRRRGGSRTSGRPATR